MSHTCVTLQSPDEPMCSEEGHVSTWTSTVVYEHDYGAAYPVEPQLESAEVPMTAPIQGNVVLTAAEVTEGGDAREWNSDMEPPLAFLYRAKRFNPKGGTLCNLRWWCDAYGPYQLDGGTGEHGLGPFWMQAESPSNPFNVACPRSANKANRCPARVSLKSDGSFLKRRHFHNHPPESDMPPPLEGELQLPTLLPSYQQVAASVITTRPQKPNKAEATSAEQQHEDQVQPHAVVQLWDEEAQQMLEIAVTEESIPKVADYAQIVELDGVNVIQCPVTNCSRSVGNRSALHKHLNTHVPDVSKRVPISRGSDEKLCPLCRMKKDSYDDLVNHIVTEHDTRLECSEHEFETMWDFKQWKKRVEQEDEALFQLGRWGAGHYSCSRGGVKTVKSNRRPRLGFECPAAIIVHSNKAQGQSSRVHVTYWRTHIGHAPSLVDIRMPKENVEWIISLLKNGHSIRSIIAQGASQYLGPPLNKIHMLTERYIRYIINDAMASADRKKTALKCPSDPPKVYEYGNVDQLRIALAGIIHDDMIREDESLRLAEEADYLGDGDKAAARRTGRRTKNVNATQNADDEWTRGPARHNDKCLTAYDVLEHVESGRYQVLGHGYKSIHKGDQPTTVVVFPRKAAHETCERKCPQCQVCVHRYGCTCRWYMMHSRMCAHIHRVASLKGPPSADYVDPEAVKGDTLGLQETLNRLQNLNRRERLKPLVPLIDELFQLLKGDHGVQPDELESYIRQGLDMLRRYRPIQPTRDDEALRGIQPLKATEARLFLRNRHPDQHLYKILATNWDIDPKVKGCKGGVMVLIDGKFKLIEVTREPGTNNVHVLNRHETAAPTSKSIGTNPTDTVNNCSTTKTATRLITAPAAIASSQNVPVAMHNDASNELSVSKNSQNVANKPMRAKRDRPTTSELDNSALRPAKRPLVKDDEEQSSTSTPPVESASAGPAVSTAKQKKVVIVKIAKAPHELAEGNTCPSSTFLVEPESSDSTAAVPESNTASVDKALLTLPSTSICPVEGESSASREEAETIHVFKPPDGLLQAAAGGSQSTDAVTTHVLVDGTLVVTSNGQVLEEGKIASHDAVDMFVATL
ncbi:hypothetical protein BIW11_06603 [Tropilaelaps mercedesae]|uniref:C2H2-type domain-containing protein n=1 Tax=Tropilaelaps mercedesae TaxID=418985 RepID=A0A1V9XXA5_9ACAR|nr:hypothetical protein BIW11_06603 [Tropilaelaps mercedesae]